MQLAEHLKAIVDAMSELIAQHIKLARVELKEDAREVGTQVGKIAAFVPLLIVGYVLVCIAAALFLRHYLPIEVGFLIVAGLNFAVGGVGILLALRRLRARKVMRETRSELQATAIVLRSQGQ